MKMMVCLDPGHGGNDPGAVNGARYEKDDVLRLALAVKERLVAQGVATMLTREQDRAVPIAERCKLANDAGCAYFLSLHRDAAGPDASGISLWVHSQSDAATLAKAQGILDELLAVAPTRDRRVNKGTPQNYENFGVNTGTNMASALLELGFITNAGDNDRFDDCFRHYADGVTKGICKAVGVTFVGPKPVDESMLDPRFVQFCEKLRTMFLSYEEEEL